jgi:hypothetical protein
MRFHPDPEDSAHMNESQCINYKGEYFCRSGSTTLVPARVATGRC